MSMFHIIRLLLLSCIIASHPLVAQSKPNTGRVISASEQSKKAQFLYGFYIAYMSGIVYDVIGLNETLRREYVTPSVFAGEIDADPLLDAQDCIQHCMQTLQVVPINNDWYKVSYLWQSSYPNIPDNTHIIYIKLKTLSRKYKIVEAKTTYPL